MALKSEYEMKDLGELNFFLGIQVRRGQRQEGHPHQSGELYNDDSRKV
jgi:hypothetical protein